VNTTCLLIGSALALGSCSLPREKVWVRLELPPELADTASQVQVKPAIAEAARQIGRGVVALQLKRDAGRTRLLLRGACPLVVDARELPSSPEPLALRPLFDSGSSERVVGLGAPFELRLSPNCAEAEAARPSLRVTGGAPLAQSSVSERGRVLRGVTASLPPATRAGHGVVPVSAREQAKLRTEITLRIELTKGEPIERRLGISAVARSSGLPNVGLSHPVLLSNDAWLLDHAPRGSQAKLRSAGGLFELTPDVAGVYRLRDGSGRQLSLQSGRYDHTPLDCGRSDCHAEIASSVRQSPMTQVLFSDLGGCHSLSDPACATACHSIGEPGTRDGGFSHVADELGLPQLPLDHDELPRALRRLGGVGCAACHGPGAIPEPSGRWAILRSDVCAVCHDAPPRYGHVAALASSRMAHADHAAGVRGQPACARCHTSWGALGRPAPGPEVEPFGISCQTCHDVHPHGGQDHERAADSAGTSHGLVRRFPLPATLPDPPVSYRGISQVCIACHAPSSDQLPPEASAASILAGQGGFEPRTGERLTRAAPHAAGPKGCLSCHDSGPDALVLGKTHGFQSSDAACLRCHDRRLERNPALALRAQGLLERLDPQQGRPSADRPWHARPTRALPTPEQTRALHNVLLVLEDPAADVHHPAYASALLDAAERVLPGAPP
jgi:hypothetical protein